VISLVIPTLNAAEPLRECLAAVAGARMQGLVTEVVVADGGSTDGATNVAAEEGARLVRASGGRGGQLVAGCAAATGAWLLVLHADTRLEKGWEAAVRRHIAERPDKAGWFRFRLDDPAEIARVWERGVNVRSRLFGLPYGDQGLLISQPLYDAVGGYRAQPLMEDVDLVRRLGRARLAEIPARAVTSSERFEREGYWRRSGRNWRLLARYLAGARPEELARDYE
jgi:rSAM/selenodomain-associated transferase 2